MKKIKLLLITISFIFVSCSSVDYAWNKSYETLVQYNHLEVGDIIILNKKFNPYSLFGHSAMVVGHNIIGEYPAYGHDYIERTMPMWFFENFDRRVIVLRHKNLTAEMQNKILEGVERYRGGEYSIFVGKINDEKFYCSSWIYKIYLDLGIDLVEDSDFYVLPYDFLSSEKLEKVEFKSIYTENIIKFESNI